MFRFCRPADDTRRNGIGLPLRRARFGVGTPWLLLLGLLRLLGRGRFGLLGFLRHSDAPALSEALTASVTEIETESGIKS